MSIGVILITNEGDLTDCKLVSSVNHPTQESVVTSLVPATSTTNVCRECCCVLNGAGVLRGYSLKFAQSAMGIKGS